MNNNLTKTCSLFKGLLILYYEGQSISNETFLITQVCNDW